MMKISVLIPTLGREREPIQTVRALLAQTHPPDEILVADQNGGAFPELDRFLAQAGPNVRQIPSQLPGVVRNMNLLLREARHEVVLYLDDDIEAESGLVAAHLTHYQEDALHLALTRKRLGGVAGRVEQPQGDLPPEQISEVGIYHRLRGTLVANFNARRASDVQLAPGGNMSFLKKALLEAGGFDEGYEGNGYFFESDASLRVVEAGYRIAFEPKASVRHLMAPRGGARIADKATHNYWFVRNGLRLNRRHSPKLLLPLFAARYAGYSALKALKNRDPRILLKAARALRDGLERR